MPKIVIVYDSKSGNTEKMAKAVAEGANGVKGVETELYKAGTRFSVLVLNQADGIILGSPSRYGMPTTEMRDFLDAVAENVKLKRLAIKAKAGGVFGSYAFDGGDVVDRLAEKVASWNVNIVPPMVAAVDRQGMMGMHIDDDDIKRCRELGKAVAEKLR